jgi:hypothetical protein
MTDYLLQDSLLYKILRMLEVSLIKILKLSLLLR